VLRVLITCALLAVVVAHQLLAVAVELVVIELVLHKL
jgi:hypothetical protein